MKLPNDTGYSVNVATITVHARHPGDHAGPVVRTRTRAGVESLLNGKRPKICRTCYPVSKDAPDVQAPTNGQVRRIDRAEEG